MRGDVYRRQIDIQNPVKSANVFEIQPNKVHKNMKSGIWTGSYFAHSRNFNSKIELMRESRGPDLPLP